MLLYKQPGSIEGQALTDHYTPLPTEWVEFALYLIPSPLTQVKVGEWGELLSSGNSAARIVSSTIPILILAVFFLIFFFTDHRV